MDERIHKYFEGLLSEEERIELLNDINSDPQLKKDLLNTQNLQGILHFSPHAIDREEALRAYEWLMNRKRTLRIRKYLATGIGYAAGVAAIVLCTWVISGIYHTKPNELITEDIQIQELYVPAGQRARITLPDGSIAWLNAGSTLTYPSRFDKERRITLSGEGYFEVAKDVKKPFIVSSGEVNIMALGTEFNVYSYPKADYFSTSLVEGSIEVYTPYPEKKNVILSPNEQLYYQNGKMLITSFNDADQLLWKEGIYSFKRETMAVIIKKLELYFDVEIIVKHPEILNYTYTGKFRQRDGVSEILRIIQKIHHFRIEKDEQLSTFILSK